MARKILNETKIRLRQEDPGELYLVFLQDCFKNLKTADKAHHYKFAKQINDVAIIGPGIRIFIFIAMFLLRLFHKDNYLRL
jgi:hypothetical protein